MWLQAQLWAAIVLQSQQVVGESGKPYARLVRNETRTVRLTGTNTTTPRGGGAPRMEHLRGILKEAVRQEVEEVKTTTTTMVAEEVIRSRTSSSRVRS